MSQTAMNENFKKYIELHDGFLTPEECKDIIAKYSFTPKPESERHHFPSETHDIRDFRKVEMIQDKETIFGNNKLTVDKILEKTRLAANDYLRRHNIDHDLKTTTIRFLQHKNGTPMKRHFDEEMDYINQEETFRLVAPIIYLNDDYQEGEIVFEEMGYTYKPKAGTLLLFPSSFTYLHHVNAPIGNNKYLLKFNFQVNKDEYASQN